MLTTETIECRKNEKNSLSYLLWLFRPISCKYTICPQECKMHLQQLSQGRFARKWNWKWISPKAQSFSFLEVRGFLHDHKKVYSFTQSCLKICNVMKYSLILSASFSFDSNTFNPKHFGYYWEEKFLSVENIMCDCFPNKCQERI